MPRMPSVPLMRASPSFSTRSTGVRSAAAKASDAGRRRPSTTTSPSPRRAIAAWARGARSPLAPRLPYSGTTGVMPAFNRSTKALANRGRAPLRPMVSVRARSSTMARTTSSSTGGPMPAACERTSASCKAVRRSAGMATVASAPNPVEMPYLGSPSANRSTTARDSAIRASAFAVIDTAARWRATETTSPIVVSYPSSSTDGFEPSTSTVASVMAFAPPQFPDRWQGGPLPPPVTSRYQRSPGLPCGGPVRSPIGRRRRVGRRRPPSTRR